MDLLQLEGEISFSLIPYYIIGFASAFILAFFSTPLVKRLAIKIGAVDKPNQRKVHQRIMPRMGGLAIFLGFAITYLFIVPTNKLSMALLFGGFIIIIVGVLDDRFELSPKVKLLGQLIAASIVVLFGVQVEFFNLPFAEGKFILGWLAIPFTIFWIVGVTNAINLIDGLDGLAAGVSAIATAVLLIMALIMGNSFVAIYCAILLGSILAFLYFNFHPAKIFMGDTGALFLGFNLAALSILGFKQVTLVSFVIPLLVLGVPLSDTFFAIIRRIVNRKPISAADKNHLHHCLLNLGLSHRMTVLVIYGISALFGLSAILLSQTTLWWAMVIVAIVALGLQIGAEAIGLVSKTDRPILNLMKKARLVWLSALKSK